MKNKNRAIGSILCLIFIISIFSPFIVIDLSNTNRINNTELNPTLSTLQFDDTISETIYQNIDYEFSTVFYDDANYRNEYTEAYLQTEYTIADYSFNDSISNVVNNFTEYAENDDITITKGTLDSIGTLDIKDANSTDIDSTDGGFYNSTYSFTNDANGAKPAGWNRNEEGTATGHVIASLGGHAKVLELNDNTPDGRVRMDNNFTDQTTDCIIEFWHRCTDYNAKELDFHLLDNDNILINIEFGGVASSYRIWDGAASVDLYVPAVNTWFRHKIEFDISASTFDYSIYNEAEVRVAFGDDYDFNAAYIDGLDEWWMRTDWADANFIHYFDAIDHNWTAGYYEGRIASADDAMIDITVLIDGFNPHLSLEALEFELYSYYKTNESVNTKFYVYNFTDSGWDLLDDSVHLNFNDKEGVIYQTPTLEKFINTSGIMLIRFLVESSIIVNFQLSIDQLGVDIWTKLHLSHTRSFDLAGLWKYRWYIIGSDYYSNWTYFTVKESILNFEAISESEYPTRWILFSNATTPTMEFQDDINTNAWILDGVSERYFEVFESESSSYLLNNYTFNDKWDYSGTHFDLSGECSWMNGIEWDGSNFWVLDDTSDEVYKYSASGTYSGVHFDTRAQDTAAKGFVWDGSNFWAVGGTNREVFKYTASGTYSGVHFDVGTEDSLPQGITWDGSNFWVVGHTNAEVFKYTASGTYTGVHFDVGAQDSGSRGIEWDGSNFWITGVTNNEVYQYTASGTYTGVHFDVGAEDTLPWGLTWDSSNFWVVGVTNNEVYQYEKVYDISKNYYGSGYTYMQTDTTELISLLSPTYSTNYTLSSGEYFEIDFQTNSDSLINLVLLKNSVVQKTLTLSPSGNTDFTQHINQIITDEDVEFDQLKISSSFEDIDYVRIYDIKTYNYTITGDSADFCLGSMRSKSIILQPDNYSLSIYEEGIKKVEKVIELTYDTLYQEIYKPIGIIECRVSLFSTDNIYLNFNEFRISVNRSLNEYYKAFWLLTNLLYVDEDTTLNFTIYDKFDTYIDSFIKISDNFIDLYIEVYSLTIKNLLEKKTTLLLNSTNSYELLSDESIEFILPKGYYQLKWTDELGDSFNITIYLDENQAYELNSSYYEVYFSLFNFDGLGLEPYLFRFYINGLRKDVGFNTLKQDTNTLRVSDYFNQTLVNRIINLRGFTEYNIYVEVWTMHICNNYSFPIKMKIERNDIEVEQVIPAGLEFEYRMLPKVEYVLKAYHLNGTLLETREIELEENNQVVSFGFFETEVPYDPEPLVFDFTVLMAFIVIISVGSNIIIIMWAYMKGDRDKISLSTRKRHNKKWKPGTFDDRF